ncbi:MAG: hypothetical protein J6U01_08025 [Clostridia bacterium]|nr:hypothetical protein [Clostridia bacterium]
MLRKTMRRKCLFLVLALLLVLLAGAALADSLSDPVKISMELSKNKFTEPGPVTVSITLSNVGEGDLPGPITLYYPSGKKVEEFGSPTLAVGSSKNWSGSWTVTQSELDNGKLTFSCKYSVYNQDGELVNKVKYFSKKISSVSADPVIEVRRTVIPSLATKGQEVTVTYEVANTGTVDITNVTIKENASVSAKSGTIERVAAGASGTYVFTTTMGTKDLTSAATVTYKANGKTFTAKVEAATVKYGEVKLSAALAADKKGGVPGDTVKLTLTLKNTGNVDFKNVTVTDAALGTVFSNEVVAAGKTATLTKEVTLSGNLDLLFAVSAEDETGGRVETATGRVSVVCMDPTQQVMMTVSASADRDKVYKLPGTVRFTITVQNDSAVEVKNVTVKAVDTAVYTIEAMAPGASLTFARDMDVSMAGTYQFTASCRDMLNQTQTFTSNAIPIAYAPPTPVPTEAPLVTPPAPRMEPMPTDQLPPAWLETAESVAGIAKWVLAGLGGVMLLLLLIGAVRRGRSRSQSKRAMDHLDGAVYRDYSAAPRGGRRSEITDNLQQKEEPVPAGKETEGTAQNSELMAETLKRLYENQPAEEPAVTVEEAPAAKAEASDNKPAAQESKSEAPESNPAEGKTARRRRKTE